MMRSIAAVAAGFFVIAILSFGTDSIMRRSFADAYDATGRTESVGLLLLTLAYVAVYAIAGCYLAARLAPNKPMKHALILGVLGLIFTTAGTAVAWATAPAWYHVIALATVLPWAWIGGRLREKELERGSPTAAPAR